MRYLLISQVTLPEFWRLSLPEWRMLTAPPDGGAPMRREDLVQYEWQESDAGPPRKYYRLTDAGRAQLAELDAYWSLINRTIANFGH